MERMRTSRILIAVILVLILSAAAAGARDVPALRGRINDTAGVLSSATAQELEDYLAAVERSSGAQVALLTIDSLDGDNLESYSIRVVDEWKLGQDAEDNGVLLLVAMAEKKIRIEVGYGLEGILTDAMSGYIIREAIVPEFRSGRFEAGIAAGLQAIGGVITGDAPLSSTEVQRSGEREESGGVPLFFILFILVFFFSRMGRYRRYRRRGMSPMSAFFLGSMLGGSARSRGYGGSSGFGGGGFGGGFSGGGGGFGGGGASGGW